ncbi:hypothetical protein BCR33DRAFT_343766 [Rhizoclosmatium globosum]|uniref:EF-hand domain-containing protein n=1 Tax=Rhizoclosmatium globosum TaxID=329046 RepID=A0A1Y2C2N4_9FUNG|nr:hypothetical protein BCR33DRAFT_343766 [Rhizoclosmatium globosum]|eukprot:ORY41298.1 hypothetical protein BCR33DRAFT_343766 [Rhizoclosmatium globosum]
MSFDEVAVVYDSLRVLEFANEEIELALMAPLGPATSAVHTRVQNEKREEESLRALLINAGAWGLVSRKRRGSSQNLPETTSMPANPAATKSIKLQDFRKVFHRVSPWKSSNSSGLASTQIQAPSTPSLKSNKSGSSLPPRMNLPRGLSAVKTLAASGSGLQSTMSMSSVSNIQPLEDVHITLVDRIYFYSSFNYSSFHANRAAPQGGMGADYMKANGANPAASNKPQETSTYVVDLASIVHTLDIMLKQPLNTRLRFLFDLHDLDGDGFLDKNELKAVMDSLLEMFEKSGKAAGVVEEEEVYMKAVSSFLNSALKLGQIRVVGQMDLVWRIQERLES